MLVYQRQSNIDIKIRGVNWPEQLHSLFAQSIYDINLNYNSKSIELSIHQWESTDIQKIVSELATTNIKQIEVILKNNYDLKINSRLFLNNCRPVFHQLRFNMCRKNPAYHLIIFNIEEIRIE